jgi:RNA polymerase sigma factor FliA
MSHPKKTPSVIAIEDYLPTVQYWARHYSHHTHQVLDYDDLVVVGLMGLMDAAQKFNEKKDVLFKTYAEFRIRGEIIDELRRQDWMSRSERKKQKIFRQNKHKLEQDLGREPTRVEMAKILPFKSREMDRIQQYESNDTLRAYQEGDLNHDGVLRDIVAESIENKDEVYELLCTLPDVHRTVIERRYFEESSLSEIAKEVHLSEGRVSQIHSEALDMLRKEIKTLKVA